MNEKQLSFCFMGEKPVRGGVHEFNLNVPEAPDAPLRSKVRRKKKKSVRKRRVKK